MSNNEFEESKLTSYALGELDEQETPAIEARVWNDEAARKEVEEIRAMAGLLKDELAKEPMPEAQAEVSAKPPMKLIPPMRLNGPGRRPIWRVRIALTAAACIMLGGLAYSILMPSLNRARESARYTSVTNSKNTQVDVPVDGAVNATASPDAPADAKGQGSSLTPTPTAGPATPPPAKVDSSKVWNSQPLPAPLMAEQPVAAMTAEAAAPKAQEAMAKQTLTLATSAAPRASVSVSAGTLALNSTARSQTDFGVNATVVDGNATQLREADLGGAELQDPFNARGKLNTEAYDRIHDNPFLTAMQNPLSTFSIDVDTASYSNVRRFLNAGQRPPKDAVRIEELLNYFPYDYAAPKKGDRDPFATHVEIAGCPWNADHRLVRVGIKGKEIAADKRPASNLVFLIDVSGSMNQPNKLPLVKNALRMLTEQLNGEDRVAMVVYAGNAGLVLSSTSCRDGEKKTILDALANLEAGGSTNGAGGITLAYQVAQDNFIKGGTNRVILCTDGDFNVGVTNQGDLTRMIEKKAKDGVFLSVMGFGMGNLKDSTMEKLADKGNGNYAYIDTESEAKKVFVEEISSTLVTIAKDVKIQIEFNPAVVSSYRLIGYENRMLAKEDFNNDKKDAGEIGAGHAVTAMYEVVPAGGNAADGKKEVDDLHFQKPATVVDGDHTGDLLILKLRYKQPEADKSDLIEITVKDDGKTYAKASDDFKFASSVAAFGMILRDSPHKGSANLGAVEEWAGEGIGNDASGYRKEFVEMVRKTGILRGKPDA